jgi:class 3 adenylate cyclase
MGFASLAAGQLRGGGVFALGTPAELAGLFGEPLPELPAGERDASGAERIAVEPCPALRESCARWLAAVARGLDASAIAAPGSAGAAAEHEYRELLAATLRTVLLADRREGLVNLFWLAHSSEIAEAVDRTFAGDAVEAQRRYRIHPLVSGLLRRAGEEARCAPGSSAALLEFRRGAPWNDALVRCIADDQLPVTERSPRAFDPGRALAPGNRRFRIGAAAFAEITRILRERLARGLESGDRGLAQLLAEVRPGAPAPADGDLDRLVLADAVREHLLRDIEGTGEDLRRSAVLRGERGRERGWVELLGEYVQLTRCLRRAEIVGALRDAVDFAASGIERQRGRERFLEGRLFRFAPGEPVTGSVRTATVLIADIRGFTRASEGLLSEGDLTRELYEVFDPSALVVRRFGGTVDKYLGDGLLATFAAGPRSGEEALAAVRSAVALQRLFAGLREQGRTAFRIGISLHTGRVAVARFLRDEAHVETTLIGRQMNIAARLAASGAGTADAAPGPPPRTVGGVSVGADGAVANDGIALSGPLLEALRAQIPLEAFHDGGVEGERWYDGESGLWLNFGYVGEARFRGIGSALPVYSLVPAAPARPGGGAP